MDMKTAILTLFVIGLLATGVVFVGEKPIKEPYAGLDQYKVVNELSSAQQPAIEKAVTIVLSKPTYAGEIAYDSIQASAASAGTELTVYNQNFALVKDVRKMGFAKGLNLVKFQDVASQIDPVSVHFKALNSTAKVEEQDYEYDLVSTNSLLRRYLDKDVTVQTEKETYTGKLLSYANGLVLETPTGIVSVSKYDNVRFPSLSAGLYTKPTLVWKVLSADASESDVQLSYLTNGVNWKSDYIAVVSDDESGMDLSGWVTIDNTAGTDFNDAKLKLVAGEVRRAAQQPAPMYKAMARAEAMGDTAERGFSEQAFYEYHLYTLGRQTTIKNNQQKQIELLDVKAIPVEKEYLFEQDNNWYYGGQEDTKSIKTVLKFKNSADKGLGMPLPAGTLKVMKADAEGQLQFVGEDAIDHTAKDEEVRAFVGYAFDIVGERTELESKRIDSNTYEKTVELKLRNYKDKLVTVTARENLGTSWTITKTTQDYKKPNSNTIEYSINVPPSGESIVTYTVQYHW